MNKDIPIEFPKNGADYLIAATHPDSAMEDFSAMNNEEKAFVFEVRKHWLEKKETLKYLLN